MPPPYGAPTGAPPTGAAPAGAPPAGPGCTQSQKALPQIYKFLYVGHPISMLYFRRPNT